VAVNPYGTAGTANNVGEGYAGPSNLVSKNNVYFAGRLIRQGTDANGQIDIANGMYTNVAVDRLGSVRVGNLQAVGAGFTPGLNTSYLPFGEELTATGNDAIKFATYTRDGSTGLDYADQRYYTSQFGRFMSADRFKRSAKVNDSGSWNKYSYVLNDPIRHTDRRGRELDCSDDDPDDDCDESDDGWDDDGLGFAYGINQSSGSSGSNGSQGNGTSINCSATPTAPGCQGGAPPTCEQTETAYVAAYLTKYNSPLAAYASTIVADSDAAGLDDRFIVALAGVETTYGTHGLNSWGTNNAFNNGHQDFSTLGDAISAVINLIGRCADYTKYKSAQNIYSVYEEGNVKVVAPAQGILNQIYGKQLSGNLSNVRDPRCP
jgi:RHS repeat-associated protein